MRCSLRPGASSSSAASNDTSSKKRNAAAFVRKATTFLYRLAVGAALIVLVIANVVNAVVEFVLLFVLDMGVAGAAWSTVIAQGGAGIALVVLARPQFRDATTWRPTTAEMLPLIRAGRSLMLRVGAMLAVFTGATSLAARTDDATLAAHSIVSTMFLFLALTLDALAVPTQTLVAEELGRGGPEAHLVARRAVRLSLAVGAGIGVLLAMASPLVSRVFTDDPSVISRATVGLILLALILVPGSLAFATDGALIGAGDYRFLGRAAVGYLAAVVPIAIAVALVPSLGIAGVWGGLLLWMVMRAAVNLRRTDAVLSDPVPT